jgi:hypothetical protein
MAPKAHQCVSVLVLAPQHCRENNTWLGMLAKLPEPVCMCMLFLMHAHRHVQPAVVAVGAGGRIAAYKHMCG